MSRLRRFKNSGTIFFITCVTYERLPILIGDPRLFSGALNSVQSNACFEVIAHALLLDHFHLVIDVRDNDLSRILQRLKMSFGTMYRKQAGMKSGRIWQHRFWDHVIRDQNDLNKHLDYVHYNAVKHGLVSRPSDWPHSSFQEYLNSGYYDSDWGSRGVLAFDGEFGE